MTNIIIAGVVALIAGFVIGFVVIRLSLKRRSANIIKEAEAEAEVIKKDKILQAKEKFLQIKAEHEKQAEATGNVHLSEDGGNTTQIQRFTSITS